MYMHLVMDVFVYTYENFRLIKQKIWCEDWKTDENVEKHEVFVWHSRGGSILDLKSFENQLGTALEVRSNSKKRQTRSENSKN